MASPRSSSARGWRGTGARHVVTLRGGRKLGKRAGLKRAARPQGLVNFADGAQQRGSIVTSNFLDKLSLRLIPPWECFLEFASPGGSKFDRSRPFVLARNDRNKLFASDRHQVPCQRASFQSNKICQRRNRDRPGLRQYRENIELRNSQTEGPECIIVVPGEQPRRSPQLEIKAAPRLVDCYHQILAP